MGDFNICDPEEGRFNVWNQPFTDGDPGKTAVFHSFFPHVLEVAQSDYTRRDSTALGAIRTLSRIDRIFISIYPWLNYEIPIATLMSLRIWGSKPFRVITQQYASSLGNHKSKSPEQTYSQLDVETSHFLFHIAAAS